MVPPHSQRIRGGCNPLWDLHFSLCLCPSPVLLMEILIFQEALRESDSLRVGFEGTLMVPPHSKRIRGDCDPLWDLHFSLCLCPSPALLMEILISQEALRESDSLRVGFEGTLMVPPHSKRIRGGCDPLWDLHFSLGLCSSLVLLME